MHRAWTVAAVTFVTIVGSAAFASLPGLLIDPLHSEFGWSRGMIGLAVSINLALYGLTAPFAAALMDRFGIRRVVACALLTIALGAGLTVFMTQIWQLVLCWGVLVGLGSGSMALAFAATVTNRWFVARRGLVTGILTAGGAAGQLVFLPLLSWITEHHGWRPAAAVVACAALAVVPFVWLLLRDHPADVGLSAYGATGVHPQARRRPRAPRGRALRALARGGARRHLLAAGRHVRDLRRVHQRPGEDPLRARRPRPRAARHHRGVAARRHRGRSTSRARSPPAGSPTACRRRRLLAIYYGLRGLSLMFLPMLFSDSIHPSMVLFIVFYGLDWVATVPPTIALCREHYGENSAIVFGWVLAAHQIGAALVAYLGGVARDALGSYDVVWYSSGALCAVAALMSLVVRHRPVAGPAVAVTG